MQKRRVLISSFENNESNAFYLVFYVLGTALFRNNYVMKSLNMYVKKLVDYSSIDFVRKDYYYIIPMWCHD